MSTPGFRELKSKAEIELHWAIDREELEDQIEENNRLYIETQILREGLNRLARLHCAAPEIKTFIKKVLKRADRAVLP